MSIVLTRWYEKRRIDTLIKPSVIRSRPRPSKHRVRIKRFSTSSYYARYPVVHRKLVTSLMFSAGATFQKTTD
jgi:hypothetical protein